MKFKKKVCIVVSNEISRLRIRKILNVTYPKINKTYSVIDPFLQRRFQDTSIRYAREKDREKRERK